VHGLMRASSSRHRCSRCAELVGAGRRSLNGGLEWRWASRYFSAYNSPPTHSTHRCCLGSSQTRSWQRTCAALAPAAPTSAGCTR
jgi:hypothetical protein